MDKEITSEFVRQMSEGVHIQDVEKNLDAVTRPCEVKQIGKYTFSIILTQAEPSDPENVRSTWI